ncbi:hypothetical protein [Erythrobacter rubeus]|uniref:TonB C-terminal domain-containing protein n=1 Tax=Erythrobacter rubeus TaxID=2760803 RepID=A0ABR8KU40_9SPHN|nr:hypothetical protein [Erythrobacter rubeus]MBD2842947.1 hypothetical protein [Erythrobacter rubeus]
MNTVTKTISAAAMAAALALPLSAPASASEKAEGASDDIVVLSASAMEQWQEDTTKDLNRALAREPITRKVQPNNAIVEVAFTMGADGTAENIEVLRGRGNWAARRVARHAVAKLDTLAEVPVANAENIKFLARIVFADNIEIKEQLYAEMKRSRPERFAAGENKYILLGG